MARESLFVAVLLFESTSPSPSYRPLYREDVVMVRATSLDSAREHVEQHGRDTGTSYTNGAGETVRDRLAHVVDVAPVLSDDLTTRVVDLYSRHFRHVDAYRRFEPLLDGEEL